MTKISLNIQNGYRKELESFCQECGLHYKAEHERKMDVQGDDEKVHELLKRFAYHISIKKVESDNKPSKKALVDKLLELNYNSLVRHGGKMKYYKEKNWRESFETYSEESLWNAIIHYEHTESVGL